MTTSVCRQRAIALDGERSTAAADLNTSLICRSAHAVRADKRNRCRAIADDTAGDVHIGKCNTFSVRNRHRAGGRACQHIAVLCRITLAARKLFVCFDSLLHGSGYSDVCVAHGHSINAVAVSSQHILAVLHVAVNNIVCRLYLESDICTCRIFAADSLIVCTDNHHILGQSHTICLPLRPQCVHRHIRSNAARKVPRITICTFRIGVPTAKAPALCRRLSRFYQLIAV